MLLSDRHILSLFACVYETYTVNLTYCHRELIQAAHMPVADFSVRCGQTSDLQ